MKWTMGRILLLVLVGVLLIGGVAAAWFVDRMAVGYLTGQRRMPGKDWFGRDLIMEGPPPGYVFLGFSRESKDPPGFRLIRPADASREIGLREGDVVTSVEGEVFTSSFDLVRNLLDETEAGDEISLTVFRDGKELELEAELEAFLRSPADLGLPYEEVEILSGNGHTLRGWFIPPPEGSDGRSCIFVHGANSSRFQALDGAPYWHERGYGLLTMDLSGRGTSGGDYITYSVNERKDVQAMMAYLRNRDEVPGEKIVVFGTSNGAVSAIYAATDMPSPAALVLDAPYSNLWDEASEMLESRGVQPQLLHLLNLAVRVRAGVNLKGVRPIEVIDRVKSPILFIHGDADTQVRPYHSRKMHEIRREKGLPSKRWVIEGGEHGFDHYPPEEEFWGRVIDFCDEHVDGP